MDTLRTLIRNNDLIRQPIDYVNILKYPLAPTDIDGVIEWKDFGWIFLECKQRGKALPYGQRIMYERLVKDLGRHKPAIAIVFYHDEKDSSKAIRACDCKVAEWFGMDEYGVYGWNEVDGGDGDGDGKNGIGVGEFVRGLIADMNREKGMEEEYGDYWEVKRG